MPTTLSVVTPSFNQGAFLEQTIQSVLGDGSYPVEYVVIDGGSRDDSVQTIERYADRLAYWCSEKDAGQYDAINKGFARTTGEIMAWINSSDLYLPWTIPTVLDIFKRFPAIDWITTLHKLCVNEDGSFRSIQRVAGFSRNAFLAGMHGGKDSTNFIQQETCFWRRSLWDKIGGQIPATYRYAGDFHLWAEFFEHAALTGVALPLAAFRFHEDQRSKAELYMDEVEKVLELGRELKSEAAHHRRLEILAQRHNLNEEHVAEESNGDWRLLVSDNDDAIYKERDEEDLLGEKEAVIHELAKACEDRLQLIERLRIQNNLRYQLGASFRRLRRRLLPARR